MEVDRKVVPHLLKHDVYCISMFALLVQALSDKEQVKCSDGSNGISGLLEKPSLCSPPPPGTIL